jgi:hypothetical protein
MWPQPSEPMTGWWASWKLCSLLSRMLVRSLGLTERVVRRMTTVFGEALGMGRCTRSKDPSPLPGNRVCTTALLLILAPPSPPPPITSPHPQTTRAKTLKPKSTPKSETPYNNSTGACRSGSRRFHMPLHVHAVRFPLNDNSRHSHILAGGLKLPLGILEIN